MAVLRPALLALALAAALAGCGGGGGSEDGGDEGPDTSSAAYDAAFDFCAGGTKATAESFAVEPTKEAVVTLVVEQISSGGTPEEEASARKGCSDALAEADGG